MNYQNELFTTCEGCKEVFETVIDEHGHEVAMCHSCLEYAYENDELHAVCNDCDACGIISPKEADILLRYGCSHCGGTVVVHDD